MPPDEKPQATSNDLSEKNNPQYCDYKLQWDEEVVGICVRYPF